MCYHTYLIIRKNLSSKKWWHLAKSFWEKDTSRSLYPALTVDNETISDDREKVQVFNKVFLLSSWIDDEQIPKHDATCNVERTLSHVVITEKDIGDLHK